MVGHRISKGKILGQCSGLNPKKASAISDIIKCECASLVGLLAPKPDINQVLAPLVNTCYECQEGLVVNHQCQVKIIHTNVSDIGGKSHCDVPTAISCTIMPSMATSTSMDLGIYAEEQAAK